MPAPLPLVDRVLDHLRVIWGDDADDALARRIIAAMGIGDADASIPLERPERWTERDVALITYGDSVLGDGRPLEALAELVRTRLTEAISVVHVLPFCPYSSDRGFSVIDYSAVDPDLGTWDDITDLGEHVTLMFDLVINHISAQSDWFQQFLADEEPGRRYIKTASPNDDLSDVVRPRSLPLLTPFETASGLQHVWTTFSEDQVDLDWSSPDLVCAMLEVIDLYVRNGARFLRLDAIGYVWKVPGTTSIHLPETHEFIKLFHTLLAVRAPHVSIITETNVPDRENRSYFGDSDEAHLIYNFSLPPLAIDGVLNGRADRLVDWLASAPAPPPGTTLFNFLASHDGIGVRPAEGFLTDEEIAGLVDLAHQQGGMHGTYSRKGVDKPYELNISFPDLFGGVDDPHMVDRILLLHTIVLSLAGLPAIYMNSLLATVNDYAQVEADGGIRRSINRGRVHLDDVPAADGDDWRSRIMNGLIERAALRRAHTAFHPDSPQTLRDLDGVLAIDRIPQGASAVSVLCNMTNTPRTVVHDGPWTDLLSGESGTDEITLQPYAAAWLQ